MSKWKTVSMNFEIDLGDDEEDIDVLEGWRSALLCLHEFIYTTTSMNVTLDVTGHASPLFEHGDVRVDGTGSSNGSTSI